MRLLLDEDSGAHSLAKELRAGGHDVVRVVDADALGNGASDAAVYAHAVSGDRVLITKNGADFISIATLAESSEHPGILVVHDAADGTALAVATIARAVANIANIYETTRGLFLDVNHHVW